MHIHLEAICCSNRVLNKEINKKGGHTTV